DDSYRKPFFITYINTAAFIFYLFPTAKAVVVNYKDTGRANVHPRTNYGGRRYW
ncbi:hypothetical protein NW754_016644, partial [Fusarium falciforme]